MVVDEGLDTGEVYRCREVPIEPGETADELTARLARLGAGLLVETLADGLGEPVPQTGDTTYAEKITPEDLHLDWTQPAEQLHRVIRVGRAWTSWRGERLLVLQAEPVDVDLGPPGSLHGDLVATGASSLRLITVQPEGRRAIPAVEWLRGARPQPGEALGG
jgi:methionyl-tRNA formyltransferase